MRALLEADAVDLLLISPERLDNPQFRSQMLPLFAERVGLLVIDEAHCISDWGHDFRPDYRRLEEMLARLPDGVAVLCTTATANDRVVADVEEQLRGARCAPTAGRSGARRCGSRSSSCPARPTGSRGWRPGCRSSRARASSTRSPSATPSWWPTGWAVAGSPPRPTAARSRASSGSRSRSGCCANDLKAVVATSALGMGYDKPDLGFVVHYQAPGSVISYYQQVGRAGRAVDRAEVVLLRGAEDRRIQDFFIQQAFPPRELVERVLARIEDGGATARELMAEVNLGRGRIDALLKVLDVEGAVSRDGSRWTRLELGLGATTPSATRA